MKKAVIILSFILLLTSCKTYNVFENKKGLLDREEFTYDDSYQYKIRKEDKISISVWGEDELGVGSVFGCKSSAKSVLI